MVLVSGVGGAVELPHEGPIGRGRSGVAAQRLLKLLLLLAIFGTAILEPYLPKVRTGRLKEGGGFNGVRAQLWWATANRNELLAAEVGLGAAAHVLPLEAVKLHPAPTRKLNQSPI